jgi:hypothetical protein
MRQLLLTTTLCIFMGVVAVAQDVPKADLFLGYSFLRVNTASTIPAFTMNGGLGALGLNFNDHVGIEFEFGGYHNGNINNHEFDTTALTYLFGPRISVGRSKVVDPYIHALFGGIRGTTSIFVAPTNGTGDTTGGSRASASQNNFAMALGGGLDLRLGKHFALRPIQLDYFLTRFEIPDPVTLVTSNRNNHDLRYAAGIVFLFGGHKEPPPPEPPKTKSCPGGATIPIDQECPKRDMGLGLAADKSEVCAGDTVVVKPSITMPDGATMNWTVNGEAVNQAPTLEFGTAGRSPGAYRIGLRSTAAGYNDGSAETTVTVLNYTPPSGTLTATPSEIWSGEKSTLSANFKAGQCGGTLGQPTFSASEGSVSGTEYDSSGVQFDPANNSEQRKTITIAANVSDGKGAGTAETTVVVKKKAVVVARRLPDIIFPVGNARVNNCGKRVLLETLKTLVDSDPTGQVILVGHTAENESKYKGLDQKRALNAAAVISAGTGICSRVPANQVQVSAVGTSQEGVDFQPQFCGTSAQERSGQSVKESDQNAKYRRVEVWFVPTGGLPPASVHDAKDAASLSVSSLGCPK